ncbi:hypothetical protein DM01DRAFT_1195411 [Hesseltinella vesiculosa]|uniref:RRM domain-containing protein n=1 Tax=Hesseltinella vesiculosa TaxID=101127 RepID=A0A1X2G3R1_9FUNG|nr:hypothetical protein DM01DRAFT_1195411 [Hesseltinella vesiculosa]
MQQERDQFSGGPIRKNHRDRHAGAPYRPRQKPHADDQNEKPSRSLFIRNIAYDTKADHILDLFRPYGDIKDTYDQIAGRGILFIHFFDIRASEQAKRDAADRLVGDRPLDVHFSVPKDDIRVIKCDQTKNQGTLLLSLNGSQDILVDKELYEEFQQFGDIKVIRTPNFKKASGSTAKWQRFIEFFDSRAAVDAAKANQGKEYKGGIWDVQYFWDQAFGKP